MSKTEQSNLDDARAVVINHMADDIVKVMVEKVKEHGDDDPMKIDMIAASLMLVIRDMDKVCNNNFSKVMAALIDYEESERKKKMN